MISPLELRNQLAGLLASQLGQYTIEGGKTAPAIAVLPDPEVGYNYPPAGTVVTGVELVIMCPINGYQPLMGNGGIASAVWELRLSRRDTNGSLRDIINALVPQLQNLPNHAKISQPIVIPPNDAKGVVEQVIIRLTEYVSL